MIRIAPSYILLLLLSVLFAAGTWYFVLPELQTLQATRSQLEASTLSSSKPAVQKIDTASASRLAERQQALVLLPVSDNQYDLAVQVEALSHSAGVVLSGLTMSGASVVATTPVSTATPATTETPLNLTITIGLSGSYTAVQQFITGLPTLDRYISINQVTMTSAGSASPASSSFDAVTASVTAVAYYLAGPVTTP